MEDSFGRRGEKCDAISEQLDETGAIRTAAFFQVEFMIRDRKKYADTLGWGFARWRGTDLKPYGKNAAFAKECVGWELPANPLRWKVITSSANRSDSTMSTSMAMTLPLRMPGQIQNKYANGSALALITWTQQEDSRWFGAKIPATVKFVEFVFVGAIADGRALYSYQEFEGRPLKESLAQEYQVPQDRAAELLSQRAAVMP